MKVSITKLAYHLPEEVLTHEQLCERFGRDVMDKVASTSGIYNRRVSAKGECASDLAFKAAQKILTPTDLEEIDTLIFATQTPDYLLPTTACILQKRLGLRKDIIAFDINLGCTQFIFGLSTAKAYIASGMAKKVLLLCADTPTKLINPLDKSAVSLFSDAATACIVEPNGNNNILDFTLGTDGSGYSDLIAPTSAMRQPPQPEDYIEHVDENQNVRANVNLYINGFKIFAFAFKIIAQMVEKILLQHNLTKDDISLFIFHQAGEKIITASAERLKLPPEKVYINLKDIGNCGGSSPAIALAQAQAEGKIKSGNKVLLCAFGVGLSWGATIIEF